MQHVKNLSPVVALILAGGQGERFGSDLPKQFVKVGRQSILQHTLKAFVGRVNEIIVVCDQKWQGEVALMGCRVADAGETGFESLCSGVASLEDLDEDTLVMVHDAVRPLVSAEIIESNLEIARRCGNAITSVETYETLFSAPDGDGVVRSMTRRDGVFRAQTPQTFTLGALRKMISEAYRLCILDVQSACVLAHQLGYELHLSPGDLRNFKITTPSDLALFEALSSYSK